MSIYLDQITDFFPWRHIGTDKDPVEPLVPDTRILKKFSKPDKIEKVRSKIRQLQISENQKVREYTEDELKEFVYKQIRRFFEVEEDNEKFILLKESKEYLDFVNKNDTM